MTAVSIPVYHLFNAKKEEEERAHSFSFSFSHFKGIKPDKNSIYTH
jgi:hypothetical protein